MDGLRVSLVPALDACIETQAKRRHRQTVSELLGTPTDPAIAQRLEILRLFLEQADLPALRAVSEPHLIAGRKVVFTVWQENGRARWEMTVNP